MPNCDKIIEDSHDTDGHDAKYCEDTCDAWVHQWCAGLSKALFKVYIYICIYIKLLYIYIYIYSV